MPKQAAVQIAVLRTILASCVAAAGLLTSPPAEAASTTAPNLTTATSIANADLLLVWPFAGGGPLQAITWQALKLQLTGDVASTWLQPSNNLSDLGNAGTARTNLGLGSAALQNVGSSGNVICSSMATPCTWSATQTFTLAPVFTAQSGTRTALGLGDLAVQNAATPPALGGTTPNTAKFSSITDTGITGSTQCVQANSSGALSGTGASCNVGATSGTWTPTFSFATPGSSSFSYSTQQGNYVCVNGLVTLDFSVAATVTLGTASGTLFINGLPYTYAAGGTAGGFVLSNSSTLNYSGWISLSSGGSNQIRILNNVGSGGGSNALTTSGVTGGSNNSLSGEIIFRTNSGVC
jgi:hypothetical protein